MIFRKAVKYGSKGRVCLMGPAGSGKTYTGLMFAYALAGDGGRVAVVDTEHGSASKYVGENPGWDFDVMELESFSPRVYIDAIHAAEGAGYDAILLDSLSHAWIGKDGALEQVDSAAARSKGNSYVGWRDVTPLHNEMIDAIVGAKLHVVCTMRSKMEYVLQDDGKGKKVPVKIGMQPVQRDGMEYEFDLVCDMDVDHHLVVGKTRCKLMDKLVTQNPSGNALVPFVQWLEGAERPATVTNGADTGYKGFLERCAKAKTVLGEEAYYQVIGGFELGHANEMPAHDEESQSNLIKALRAAAKKETAA